MSGDENNKLTGSGGCGCGGGGGSSVPISSCSCGGKGCGLCYTSAFVRPNFFAGQLLTEDDLQKLGEYVVAKNRLHNRFLFGEGVVCGLEVTCDPCGQGRVLVHPGYALDCCGNDLTLACATTLDINSMVRELRRTKLGADCGDPCADSKAPPAKEEARVADPKRDVLKINSVIVNPDYPGRPIETKPETATRHFCLYMRYCEQSTDPVAPYSTGEPCGASGCETTRIREGVSFELRCTKDDKPRNDILTRIRACFGDFGRIDKNARDIQYHNTISGRSQAALAEINRSAVPAFEEMHANAMMAAPASLETEVRKFETAQPVPQPAPVPETAPPPPPAPAQPAPPPAKLIANIDSVPVPSAATSILRDQDARQALDVLLDTASVVARFYARPETERRRLLEQFKLQAPLKAAEGALARAASVMEYHPAIEILPTSLERESARATIDLSKELGSGAAPAANDMQMRLLAERVVITPKLHQASMNSLDDLRDFLLDRMDQSSNLTDCELRRELAMLILPTRPLTPEEIKKITPGEMTQILAASRILIGMFLRYMRDCICAAFNPSCAPCDDTAVLLACVEVRDCDVVRICSLERTFVLSPAAMRYWLPPLSLLGEALELICCSDIDALGRKLASVGRYVERFFRSKEAQGFGIRHSSSSSVVDLIEQLPNFNTARVANFSRSMAGLFQGAEIRASLRDQGMFSSLGRVEAEAETSAAPTAVESFAAFGALRERLTKEVTAMIDKRIDDKVAELRKIDAAGKPPSKAASSTRKTKDKANGETPPQDKG